MGVGGYCGEFGAISACTAAIGLQPARSAPCLSVPRLAGDGEPDPMLRARGSERRGEGRKMKIEGTSGEEEKEQNDDAKERGGGRGERRGG